MKRYNPSLDLKSAQHPGMAEHENGEYFSLSDFKRLSDQEKADFFQELMGGSYCSICGEKNCYCLVD